MKKSTKRARLLGSTYKGRNLLAGLTEPVGGYLQDVFESPVSIQIFRCDRVGKIPYLIDVWKQSNGIMGVTFYPESLEVKSIKELHHVSLSRSTMRVLRSGKLQSMIGRKPCKPPALVSQRRKASLIKTIRLLAKIPPGALKREIKRKLTLCTRHTLAGLSRFKT